MYNEVLNLFDIETNIGFIGGKNSRAFYFIGKYQTNLIFLDPHYVQDTLSLKKLGTDNAHETYTPNDIFYMPIADLSASITCAFAIKDMTDFKKLMIKLSEKEYYCSQNKKNTSINKELLFKVKNSRQPFEG